MNDSVLFSDTFVVTNVNAQKYDRVSRASANNPSGDVSLTLDVNTELYPLTINDHMQLVLASTLNMDGSKDEAGKQGWRDVGSGKGEETLADGYDYVCHGKVYRFEEGGEDTIKVFTSFGGLLLYMEGPYRRLTPLRIDYIYLLLKK